MLRNAKQVSSFCAALLLLVLTAAGLFELAQWQFTTHLRNEAARELVLDATGGSPWQWDFHPENIVAGRVFGDTETDFASDCLLVKSRGKPFEIGLRLARTVPLSNFTHLRLFAYANTAAQAQIVVRERLDGNEWTSSPFPLAGISTPTNIDIEKIQWRAPDGAAKRSPNVAAMLRLRFTLQQDAIMQFNGVAFERPAILERLDLNRNAVLAEPGKSVPTDIIPVYRIPDAGFDAAQIATITSTNQPILALAQTQRVEQQRLMLNTIHAALPTAIVVPQSGLDTTFALALAQAQATRSASSNISAALRWTALIVFAAVLLFARIHPPRRLRVRASLELALVLAPPLWLVMGGHFTGAVDTEQKFFIACIAAYALSLGLPRHWKWNGSARAWLLAMAVAALAACIGLAAHFSDDRTIRPIGSAHMLRYFGWALIQQYLVCVVCTSRWKLVTDSNLMAIWLGALGFALLHTPNADLMLATFAGGLCWCALYLRERALLPLAFSHAASALLLITLLPPSWLYSAEVSARFFQ